MLTFANQRAKEVIKLLQEYTDTVEHTEPKPIEYAAFIDKMEDIATVREKGKHQRTTPVKDVADLMRDGPF
tara:strand:+ start:3420 stop:3632 length:213 start_codon:yes stop_codon:yes gene_type:complete